MNKHTFRNALITVIVIIAIILIITIALALKLFTQNRLQQAVLSYTADQPCEPTFVDGGGPYYEPNSPFRNAIADPGSGGADLTVAGRVLASDCETPVAGAVVDVWQASSEGEYEDEWYRGQVESDENGYYTFSTVIPKGYGEGTAYRPPHIHFKIHLGGSEIITSQMFFPDVTGRAGFNDAYIMTIEEVGDNAFNGYHNIILP